MKGQLLGFEIHWLFIGIAVGLVIGFGLIYASGNNFLPFELPLVCGK